MSGVLLWAAVGAIGAVSAVARVALQSAVQRRVPGLFPYGTLVVNVAGCLLLGVLTGLALRGDARLLLATAALGSFTTFSTWMYDSWQLVEEDRLDLALLNLAGSTALGLAALAAGWALAGSL